eukprot:gnl/Chilomastix_cuspidata/3173.p1 GENE.gnl/Chilomastix_cuspidata/3173~~gnl/Chilomastix_cuspidata/3173.p1  ORF type:complete len:568 (-),score=240.20 gnl/Chilomastix_cuspidata/3173:24-1619(-)
MSEQREYWDDLKRGINSLVNKATIANLQQLIPLLFRYNLVKGRGVFCRTIMAAQSFSPHFTDVYAALASVVNSKLPAVGALLCKRVLARFLRAYRANDKAACSLALRLLAALVNQGVVAEVAAVEAVYLLLEAATPDSVDLACEFTERCGQTLSEYIPEALAAIFDRLRAITQEGRLPERSVFNIERLHAARRGAFEAFPPVPAGADLVPDDEQFVHELSLADAAEFDLEKPCDFFAAAPADAFAQERDAWAHIAARIVGDGDGDGDGDSDDSDGEGGSDSADVSEGDGEGEAPEAPGAAADGALDPIERIHDMNDTEVLRYRRDVYLDIMSSLTAEETAHKLLRRAGRDAGRRLELCAMFVECCQEEHAYRKFYGNVAARLCRVHGAWQDDFGHVFELQYRGMPRLKTNKIRNVAKLYGFLLATECLPWHVLSCVRLTLADTTSSHRIFIKVLFLSVVAHVGKARLRAVFERADLQDLFHGTIFPRDDLESHRMALEFFEVIKLREATAREWEFYRRRAALLRDEPDAAR